MSDINITIIIIITVITFIKKVMSLPLKQVFVSTEKVVCTVDHRCPRIGATTGDPGESISQ